MHGKKGGCCPKCTAKTKTTTAPKAPKMPKATKMMSALERTVKSPYYT